MELDPDNIEDLKLINSISTLLVEMIRENDKSNKFNEKNLKCSIFSSSRIPNVSIEDFIIRFSRYAKFERATLFSIVIYIDRLCHEDNFILSFNNIHRVLISLIVLAVKFNEDNQFKQPYYAKIGGVSTLELNLLEYSMYIELKFNMFIKQNEYDKYINHFSKFVNNKNKDIE